MSVATETDRQIDIAKEKISEAYAALLVVLDERTWGHSDYKKEYLLKIHESLIKLASIKDDL